MSGFFGVASKTDCVLDLFFGVDYHSHLGTKRAGLAVYGEFGFQRSIHNIENTPFRTKFESDVAEFKGTLGIGCISDAEAQPLLVNSHIGSFAIATVGRINNVEELKEECFNNGKVQFMEMSHGKLNQTELVAAIINLKNDAISGIKYAQEKINGSMSIMLLFKDKIIVSRDKLGRTPVVIGKKRGAYCASFESSSYLNLGYKFYYELGPGEIISFDAENFIEESKALKEMKVCSFLWTYYGYPTSNYEGVNVEKMRYHCGKLIRKRDNVDADVVAGVPDSGIPHAIGYSNESGIPYARPLIKYTPTWPRSFMPQNQKQRNLIARMKLITVNDIIKDKKIVLIDDSIVRGTQLRETAELLYDCGAKEIHVRSACPPIMYSCKYLNFSRSTSAMDLMARRTIAELEGLEEVPDELVEEYCNEDSTKYRNMVEAICKKMNFDSLEYHRLNDLVEAIGLEPCKLCTYCFNGKG